MLGSRHRLMILIHSRSVSAEHETSIGFILTTPAYARSTMGNDYESRRRNKKVCFCVTGFDRCTGV